MNLRATDLRMATNPTGVVAGGYTRERVSVVK
jgi:hypothetical protein